VSWWPLSFWKKDGDLSDDSFFFVFFPWAYMNPVQTEANHVSMKLHGFGNTWILPSWFTQDLNQACSFVFLFFIEGICTTAVCIAPPPRATCLPYCYRVEINFILSCFGDTVPQWQYKCWQSCCIASWHGSETRYSRWLLALLQWVNNTKTEIRSPDLTCNVVAASASCLCMCIHLIEAASQPQRSAPVTTQNCFY
jgi:hypothetical protein